MSIRGADAPGPVGWDDPRTAEAYEAFCERHGRYREANEVLIGRSALEGSARLLDLAAGTGRTAEAALSRLGPGARVLCVEPAAAMRARGARRLADPRVTWARELPASGPFDRILCGAALWQLTPLAETVARLRTLLSEGGAFAFDIPALYLGEPDEPGGGADACLTGLFAALARGRAPTAEVVEPLPDADGVDTLLAASGFRAERWSFRVRITQETLRDWLKIPVLTDALLMDLAPDARAKAIDAAFGLCDSGSWRWESWRGWTAWAV